MFRLKKRISNRSIHPRVRPTRLSLPVSASVNNNISGYFLGRILPVVNAVNLVSSCELVAKYNNLEVAWKSNSFEFFPDVAQRELINLTVVYEK